MRDQHPDGRACGAGGGLRQYLRAKGGQVQSLRSYAGGCLARQGAADRRMLCVSRMQGRRREAGGQILFLYSRSAESVDRPLEETSADDSSSRAGGLHGCRQDDQVAVKKEIGFLTRARYGFMVMPVPSAARPSGIMR